MADRLNHRLWVIGNYLKNAQAHLDGKIAAVALLLQEMEISMNQLETKIIQAKITTSTNIIVVQNNLQILNQQVEHPLQTIEHRLDNAKAAI